MSFFGPPPDSDGREKAFFFFFLVVCLFFFELENKTDFYGEILIRVWKVQEEFSRYR